MRINSEEILFTADVLSRKGQHEEAVNLVQKLAEALPEMPRVQYALGVINGAAGNHQAAIDAYRVCLKLDPNHIDAEWNLALMLLRTGNLYEGYKHYEVRWKTEAQKHEYHAFPKPLWLGLETLENKTIFVWHEQGSGDFIQMARYFHLLCRLAKKVYVQSFHATANLITDSMAHNLELIEPGHEPLEYDYHIPIMSLPLAFGTTINTIPATCPYLTVGHDYMEKWSYLLGLKKRPRIGLVWSGAAGHKNDANRSIPLAAFRDIMNLNADIHFLQKDIRDSDKPMIIHDIDHDHSEHLNDFSDTAALIEHMDIVLSVDTSVAHLAGALGKSLILLAPRFGDYRWGINQPTSYWYPTAYLIHQNINGDWTEAISKAKATIENMLGDAA